MNLSVSATKSQLLGLMLNPKYQVSVEAKAKDIIEGKAWKFPFLPVDKIWKFPLAELIIFVFLQH